MFLLLPQHASLPLSRRTICYSQVFISHLPTFHRAAHSSHSSTASHTKLSAWWCNIHPSWASQVPFMAPTLSFGPQYSFWLVYPLSFYLPSLTIRSCGAKMKAAFISLDSSRCGQSAHYRLTGGKYQISCIWIAPIFPQEIWTCNSFELGCHRWDKVPASIMLC